MKTNAIKIESGYLYNKRTGDVWCGGSFGWMPMPSKRALSLTRLEAEIKIQDESILGADVCDYCFRVCERELCA